MPEEDDQNPIEQPGEGDTPIPEGEAPTPDDAGEATGHGVRIKRAKNNSLRISEVK